MWTTVGVFLPMMTHETFVSRLDPAIKKRYVVLGEYAGTQKTIKIRCRKHGLELTPKAGELLYHNGHGCHACWRENLSSARTQHTPTSLAAQLSAKFPDVSFKPGKRGRDVVVRCPCGSKARTLDGYQLLRTSKHGGMCRTCVNEKVNADKRSSLEVFTAQVRAVQGEGVKFTGYTAGNQKLRVWCDGCVCEKGKRVLARTLLQSGLCHTKSAMTSMRKRSMSQIGSVRVVRGKSFRVNAAESLALTFLLGTYAPSKIMREGVTVPYQYARRHSVYVPDFFMPSTNSVLEVKSIFTLGLGRTDPWQFWRKNKAKFKAALAAGYSFDLFLVDGDARVYVPPVAELVRMTRKQAMAAIRQLNVERHPA